MNKYINTPKTAECRKAFTLIEVMVSLAITLLILAGLYGTFTIGRTFWSSQSTAIDVQDDARKALESISRELMFALELDRNPATLAVEPLDTTPVNSIAFKIPVYCNGNGVFIGDHYIESVVDPVTLTKNIGAYLAADFDTDPATGRIRLASADASRRGRRIVYSIGGLNNSQLIGTVQNINGTQAEAPRILANNITAIQFRTRNMDTARKVVFIEADVAKSIFPGWVQPENTITLRTSVRTRN
jgi:prepilin-type N-terminal cleavage/methylation domain-containing protein